MRRNNVKETIGSMVSWCFMIIMFVFLAFSTKSAVESRKTGEASYVFGYRLIYLTSGSMEPTIKTNGMALTKKVDSLADIKEGDIISFQIIQNDGSEIRATHRIYNIDENGYIYTKGDNNSVVDSYPIQINSVESRVCVIFNFTAWFVDKWQSGVNGRIFLVCMLGTIIFGYIFISLVVKKKKIFNNREEDARE